MRILLLALLALPLAAQISNPQIRYVTIAPSGSCSAIQIAELTPNGTLYTCQNGTWGTVGGGGGVSSFNTRTGAVTLTSGDVTTACSTCTITIASGASAMATGAISSGTCATVVTASATGTLTTDVVSASFNGDPTAVTGYAPVTTGALTIYPYPTANNVNFKVCNSTLASITPGAVTINWRITR